MQCWFCSWFEHLFLVCDPFHGRHLFLQVWLSLWCAHNMHVPRKVVSLSDVSLSVCALQVCTVCECVLFTKVWFPCHDVSCVVSVVSVQYLASVCLCFYGCIYIYILQQDMSLQLCLLWVNVPVCSVANFNRALTHPFSRPLNVFVTLSLQWACDLDVVTRVYSTTKDLLPTTYSYLTEMSPLLWGTQCLQGPLQSWTKSSI